MKKSFSLLLMVLLLTAVSLGCTSYTEKQQRLTTAERFRLLLADHYKYEAEVLKMNVPEVISVECFLDKNGEIKPFSCSCVLMPSMAYCDAEQRELVKEGRKKIEEAIH